MSQTPNPPTPPSASGYQAVSPATAHRSLPTHEHASLALGLGIVGLLGLCTCGAGFLVSPFALAYGISSRRAILRSPEQWAGEGMALSGIVLGAIGVVLLVVAIVAALVLAILAMNGTIQPTPDGGIKA